MIFLFLVSEFVKWPIASQLETNKIELPGICQNAIRIFRIYRRTFSLLVLEMNQEKEPFREKEPVFQCTKRKISLGLMN